MSAQEQRVVSVFGSAQVVPGSPEYERVQRLGRLLAEAGCTVVTGGFGGCMEAACRGARTAGGHTVGVTLPAWGVPTNAWVCEDRPQASYIERLVHLVARADGYVAVDGGVGTLTELALTWSLLETHALPARPLVALGGRWRRLLQTIADELILRPQAMEAVQLVDTPEEVLAALQSAWLRC